MDLSFVPIDDLIKEAEKRCSSFICSYYLNEEATRSGDFVTCFGKGNWLDSVALSNALNNDCLNNWRGELQTLQKLNEDM